MSQVSSGTAGTRTEREVTIGLANPGPNTPAERSNPVRWRPASHPQERQRDGQSLSHERIRTQPTSNAKSVSEQDRERDASLITAATTAPSAAMDHAAEHGGELPEEVGTSCAPT